MIDRKAKAVVFVVKNMTPYFHRFLNGLRQSAQEAQLVVIVTGGRSVQPWPESPFDGIELIEIRSPKLASFRRPASYLSSISTSGDILAAIGAFDPLAVVVHGYDDPAYVRLIHSLSKQRIPVVLRADTNDIADRTKARWFLVLKQLFLRSVFRHVDAFMPVGTSGREYFRRYGVADERIFIVPLEPDYSSLARPPEAEALRLFRSNLGLAKDRRTFLCIGRLVGQKRIDVLIRAFSDVAPIRPDWNLMIAGNGPLAHSLHDLVPSELRDRVTWTGFLQPAEVSLACASSRVLILPSEHEPWGLVVNEAVAAGLAIIVSNAVGAATDLVPDSAAGWIFPANDQRALTAAMLEATGGEAERRAQVARERLRLFRHRYDTSSQVRSMLDFVTR